MTKEKKFFLFVVLGALIILACALFVIWQTNLQVKKQNAENNARSGDFVFGQEFTLKKGQSAKLTNADFTVLVTDFVNSPCPENAQCFWSGTVVNFVLQSGGQKFSEQLMKGSFAQMFGYKVELTDTDYETFAKFKVTTQTGAGADLNSYTSPSKYGFSFEYPKDFGFDTNIEHTRGLAYIPVCDENMLACAFLEKNKLPGTNFDGAGVSVNLLKDFNEKRCGTFNPNVDKVVNNQSETTINGIVYKTATGGDAGMGHSETLKVFRSFQNGFCFEISEHIGQTAIGNYPEGTVKEFSSADIQNKLDLIVQSLKFEKSAQASTKLQVCPESWVEDDMPTAGGSNTGEQKQYYILKGVSRPLSDFDTKWVAENCKLELLHAY